MSGEVKSESDAEGRENGLRLKQIDTVQFRRVLPVEGTSPLGRETGTCRRRRRRFNLLHCHKAKVS